MGAIGFPNLFVYSSRPHSCCEDLPFSGSSMFRMSALTLIFIKFSNSVLCLAPLSFIFPDISSELSWCLHTLLDVYVKFVYWLSCFDLFVHCCNACIHMLTSASAVIHLMRPKTYLDIPHTRCLPPSHSWSERINELPTVSQVEPSWTEFPSNSAVALSMVGLLPWGSMTPGWKKWQ